MHARFIIDLNGSRIEVVSALAHCVAYCRAHDETEAVRSVDLTLTRAVCVFPQHWHRGAGGAGGRQQLAQAPLHAADHRPVPLPRCPAPQGASLPSGRGGATGPAGAAPQCPGWRAGRARGEVLPGSSTGGWWCLRLVWVWCGLCI